VTVDPGGKGFLRARCPIGRHVTAAELVAALDALVALPRELQVDEVRRLYDKMPASPAEAWNVDFSAGSLYAAFAESEVAQGVYAAHRKALAPVVAIPGFVIVDVGGGTGRMWEGLCPAGACGEVVVIDPHARGADGVRARVPGGVEVRHLQRPVQDVAAPEADAVVASLVLHHIAGRTQAERERHGLAGPGKIEVLQNFGESVRRRAGLVIVAEADVHCEVDLPPGDPVLRERLIDSYVRRFARSIAADAVAASGDRSLQERLVAIVRGWSLGQIAVADAPIEQRDVYELAVEGWLASFAAAGLVAVERRFTDRWRLFHHYRCVAAHRNP
jgi:2-polyprenyl-3-methyl-5-hydroxy-6-metoxy-1,4-benzoquinol methylase